MTAQVSLRAPLFEVHDLPTAAAAPALDAPDLAAALGVLWRRKWTLLGAALLATMLGGLWATLVMTPRYHATATVLLTPESNIGPVEGLLPGLSGSSTVVTTEAGILRARSLLARLVADQDLLRDPEFNPVLTPPGPLDGLWQRFAAEFPGWVPPRLAQGLAPAPTPDPAAQRILTIDALAARVSVRNMPDSLIFEVTTETDDPAKSARVANALVRLYIADQINAKAQATEQAAEWLAARVADLRHELESADSQARAFSAEMELVSSRTLVALSAQLKDVRERIARGTALMGEEPDPRARNRLSQLAALEQDLTGRITRQSNDSVALGQYQREAEASRLIYEHFLTRLKETAVQKGLQQADSRMLSPAEPPLAPARPRSTLIALLAGSIALLLAAATVSLRESGRDSFRTTEALESFTRRTVLGQSLRLRTSLFRRLFRRRTGVLDQLLSRPQSAAAEALRNLRTSLLMKMSKPPQVIMITSSLPGEGKSTLTLGLAHNISSLGRRVLVIEGDIRKRVFASYFPGNFFVHEDAPVGDLMAVLKGRIPLSQAVRHHPGLKADLLLASPSPGNPADLLATRQFSDLIATARQEYDFILIDTPPVLAVPDARIVAEFADAILYAVHWDKTRGRILRQGLRALETARLQVSGLVLTRVNPRKMRRFGLGAEYTAKGYYAE